ncbi:hypothetical protein [Pantoea sp. ANP04]
MSEVASYKGPHLSDEKYYVRLDFYNELKVQRDTLEAAILPIIKCVDSE